MKHLTTFYVNMTNTLPTIVEEAKPDVRVSPTGPIPAITVNLHDEDTSKAETQPEEKNGGVGENISMNNSIQFEPQYTSTADVSSIVSVEATLNEEGPPDPYDGLFEPLHVVTAVKDSIKEAEPNLFKYEGHWRKAKHRAHVISPVEATSEADLKLLDQLKMMTSMFVKENGGIANAVASAYAERDTKKPQSSVGDMYLMMCEALRGQEELWALIQAQDKMITSLRRLCIAEAKDHEALKVKVNEILAHLQMADRNAANLHDDVCEASQLITANTNKIEAAMNKAEAATKTVADFRQHQHESMVKMAVQTNEGLATLAQQLKRTSESMPGKNDLNSLQVKEKLTEQVIHAQGSKLVDIEHKLGVLHNQFQYQQQSVQVANSQQLKVINVPSKIQIGASTAKVVTGEELYSCNICGVPFNDTDSLKSHTNKYHRDAINFPVVCNLCEPPHRFRTEEDKLTHSMVKHKEVQINVPAEDTDSSYEVHHSVVVGGIRIPRTMTLEATIKESEQLQVLEKLKPLYSYIQPQHIRFYKRLTTDGRHLNTPYHMQVAFHDQRIRDFVLEGTKAIKAEVYPFRSPRQIEHSQRQVAKYGEHFLGAGMTGLDRGPLGATVAANPPVSLAGGVSGAVPPPGYILVPELPVVAQPGATSAPISNIGQSQMSAMVPSLPQPLWPQPMPQAQQPQPRRGGRGRGGHRTRPRIFKN